MEKNKKQYNNEKTNECSEIMSCDLKLVPSIYCVKNKAHTNHT